MTDPASVEAIYASVIEDTIFKLSPEFENAGVPMVVLSRLQELWTKRMELTVRNPAPPVSTLPMAPKGTVPVNHSQISQHAQAKKEEEGNGNSTNGFSSSSAPHADSALGSATLGAAAPSNDPLRYTVTEPLPAVKPELADGQVSNNEAVANNVSEESKPSATPAAKKDDSDSDSSSVSDDDDVDTSTWTNSIMSLYEDPIKRNKDKRTYKLQKGILHINGQDYLFKNGRAEFAWV